MSLDFPFLTSSRLGRNLAERLLGHRQIAARLHGECAPDTAEEDGVNIARSLPQQPGQRVRHVSFVESIQLPVDTADPQLRDRKSTRLNSSHSQISYAVFCLKKKKIMHMATREL